MTKKALIFHGANGKPTEYWYSWLGDQLVRRGYRAEIPYYPTINAEPIEAFLLKVMRNHTFDEETVLVGHSAGATLLLSILQQVEVVIPQAIFVAPFSPTVSGHEEMGVLQSEYDWDRIKAHVGNAVFINSVNDPWDCDDTQGRYLFDRLGGMQIIREDGHFGTFPPHEQEYPTFSLLDLLIP